MVQIFHALRFLALTKSILALYCSFWILSEHSRHVFSGAEPICFIKLCKPHMPPICFIIRGRTWLMFCAFMLRDDRGTHSSSLQNLEFLHLAQNLGALPVLLSSFSISIASLRPVDPNP